MTLENAPSILISQWMSMMLRLNKYLFRSFSVYFWKSLANIYLWVELMLETAAANRSIDWDRNGSQIPITKLKYRYRPKALNSNKALGPSTHTQSRKESLWNRYRLPLKVDNQFLNMALLSVFKKKPTRFHRYWSNARISVRCVCVCLGRFQEYVVSLEASNFFHLNDSQWNKQSVLFCCSFEKVIMSFNIFVYKSCFQEEWGP